MSIPPIIGVLGALIVSPRTAFKMILVERRGVPQALLLVLLVGLSVSGSLAASVSAVVSSFVPGIAQFSSIGAAAMVGLGVLAAVVDWIVASLLTYLFVHLLGGEPGIGDTMGVLGFSYSVFFFVPLLSAAFAALHPIAGIVAFSILVVAALAWWVIEASIGVSEAHSISTGRAALSVILARIVVPLVLVAVLGLLG